MASIAKDNVLTRKEVWKVATEILDPILADHELKTYNLGNVFQPVTIVTSLDQHIDAVMRVANWLMDKEN